MKKYFFLYNLRENKNIIVITIIALLGIGGFCIIGMGEDMKIIRTYEMFLLPFVGCWVVYSFWDYVEESVREIFLSYPKSRVTIGLGKIAYMFLLFTIIYSILFFITFAHMQGKLIYYIGMVAEIIFWVAIGYYLIIKTHSMIVSISIIWVYTAIQILDVEKYFAPIAIYMYTCDSVEGVLIKSCFLIVVALILLVISQKRFYKMTL